MSFFPADAAKGIGSPYDAIILDAAARYVMDPMLIKAMITKESTWDPNAYRYEGKLKPPDASRGLMQILYRTAQWVGYTDTPEGLFDPTININFGVKYLATQLNLYGYPAGISAYNAGSPITGNAQYVNDITNAYAWFIANDPLAAPGGAAAPPTFPRLGGVEWWTRRAGLLGSGH